VYLLGRAARRLAARGCAALGLSAVLLLAGCHNFFVCEGKASCPSGGGGGSTSDWVYVSNASAGSTDIYAYDISNGSLAAISGSPYNIGFAPVAMAISPNNSFLYAAAAANVANPGIYMWTINSSGQITSGNNGNVLISATVASMDISPDGGFLFTVDTLGTVLNEYQINTTSGLLSLVSSFALLPNSLCAPTGSPVSQSCTVKVAPSGQFVVAALGSAGDIIYPYTSTNGITGTTATTIPSGSTSTNPSGDFSLALDKNNFVYIARTAALAVYSLDASGNPTQKSTQAYNSSTIARSVTLSTDFNYVYTANIGAGNISGYSINSTGALSTLSGSPFTGPTNVSAIGTDKSGKYMVAVGYNGTSGVQLFGLTSGVLALVTSAGTGTSPDFPAILAMSH
jgi:6-phosphogluconolactonase (cycloisomerase 2 family)